MDAVSLIGDNITELLTKIVQFAKVRRRILRNNIRRVDDDKHIPMDLPVAEFARILDHAVNEHIVHGRLVFCDGRNVRFGENGTMEVRPIVDRHLLRLMRSDREAYLKTQGAKAMENSINERLARQLLEHKHPGAGACESLSAHKHAGPDPLRRALSRRVE